MLGRCWRCWLVTLAHVRIDLVDGQAGAGFPRCGCSESRRAIGRRRQSLHVIAAPRLGSWSRDSLTKRQNLIASLMREFCAAVRAW